MKHDIVYFVKDTAANEELRYSLRSVCENFSYRRVWFYGGRPSYLLPDGWEHVVQNQRTKWMRTTNMIRLICQNDEISKDWWLFNDDFFILNKLAARVLWPYEGDLYRHIVEIEDRHGQKATPYTQELRRTAKLLSSRGMTTYNFALHMPILINKEKALATLEEFPECPMFRNLYGNMHGLVDAGAVETEDVKIAGMDRLPRGGAFCISTVDSSFSSGAVGRLIRERFQEPCKYEL